MQVGTLEVEVKRDGKRTLLVFQGYPYGQETEVTKAELSNLSHYLADEAEKLHTVKERG